jgi:hypothetical protein
MAQALVGRRAKPRIFGFGSAALLVHLTSKSKQTWTGHSQNLCSLLSTRLFVVLDPHWRRSGARHTNAQRLAL